MHKSERKPTPCGTCPKPFLSEDGEWLWEVFIALSSQSRSAGMGGWAGFDYSALPFILEAQGVERSLWPIVLKFLTELAPIAAKHFNKDSEEQ